MTSFDATAIPKSYDLVDATWALPGRTEPLDGYLPRTTHSVDTGAIKVLPIESRVANASHIFGQAGLGGHRSVAVYDRVGLFSAPWVWWLLRSHGSEAALIEGWSRETTDDIPPTAPLEFQSKRNPALMNANKNDVLAALGTETQIIDARPAARFLGEAPEPRPECRAGHIPGSVNIPFSALKSGRHFLDQERLWDIFSRAEIDLDSPIITTCGSGVTASGLAFALTRCGAKQVRVYQGSWAEWGVDPSLPMTVGTLS